MLQSVTGYHFDVQFGPMLKELGPALLERAQAVGVPAKDAYELRPRAMALRLAGTRWTGLRSGDVQFQVLELRGDLDAYVIQDASVTSKKVFVPFGVAEQPKGWISTRLNRAVGLWLRDGSLLFHDWQDARSSAMERVLVDFDMWQALDTLARFASGEPSFGGPVAQPEGGRQLARLTPYASPIWAKALTTGLRLEGAQADACFDSPMYMVSASVTLMQA